MMMCELRITRFAVAALLLFAAQHTCSAASATWADNPISEDWNTVQNWIPNTVPNGPTDVAAFATSQVTSISLTGTVYLGEIRYKTGAAAFVINAAQAANVFFEGKGIVNSSGVLQTFLAEGTQDSSGAIEFSGRATAGNMTKFSIVGGSVLFEDSSNAGNATLTVGADVNFNQGFVIFFSTSSAAKGIIEATTGGVVDLDESSTAGSATFVVDLGGGLEFAGDSSATNSSSTINPAGVLGFTQFATAAEAQITLLGAGEGDQFGGAIANLSDQSTLEDAVVEVDGGTSTGSPGAVLKFFENATGGAAMLTVNGGTSGGLGGSIQFYDQSDGGNARLIISGNGSLDIGKQSQGAVGVGSIEGNGPVFLGANSFVVGSNNRSTTFSGVIQDGGLSQKTGGKLTKAGTGTLTLSGANTYTGATTVSAGVLKVGDRTGSATGTGTVNVNAGTLGGKGIIAGATTIGTGSGAGSFLAPSAGSNRPATLTIQSALTFKADGTYTYRLNTNNARADQVIAKGVTIENGAQFDFQAMANKKLTNGTVFIAISNTSATPISGAFTNLPDNSTFTTGRNKYQVSYEGGDGNDLTLTVVP